ncbi:enoyl-CoA hydratase, partial [Mesorhizobium sp. M4A.F.Ca.ET.050.02.1.1]
MTELVLCESRDRVAVLTLNRPEKLNALNYALIDRLLDMLDRIETDDAVRAVILTGAGERAFSAGADIHEFSVSVAAGADVALRDFVMRGQRLTARLEAFRKPVIAAVNGIAFGGGCEITEAVPLAIASD